MLTSMSRIPVTRAYGKKKGFVTNNYSSKVLIYGNFIPDTGADWEATGIDLVIVATLGSTPKRSRQHWVVMISRAGRKEVKVWTPGLVKGQSLIKCEME